MGVTLSALQKEVVEVYKHTISLINAAGSN